jgi:hypothetical protein
VRLASLLLSLFVFYSNLATSRRHGNSSAPLLLHHACSSSVTALAAPLPPRLHAPPAPVAPSLMRQRHSSSTAHLHSLLLCHRACVAPPQPARIRRSSATTPAHTGAKRRAPPPWCLVAARHRAITEVVTTNGSRAITNPPLRRHITAGRLLFLWMSSMFLILLNIATVLSEWK